MISTIADRILSYIFLATNNVPQRLRARLVDRTGGWRSQRVRDDSGAGLAHHGCSGTSQTL